MNLIVIGLNHRSAPVEVREQLAFAKIQPCRGAWPVAGGHATARVGDPVDLQPRGDLRAGGQRRRRRSRSCGDFSTNTTSYPIPLTRIFTNIAMTGCIQHLFEVACGLDSMVLGETEILGQVKQAYSAAQEAGATGAVLNRLFQKTFSAAKHIRSTTAITRGSTSVGTVAVDLAEKIFGKLGKCSVMVIGTGEMSAATARVLRSRGAGTILVCSRTHERAETLAVELEGRAISYEQWANEFPAIDIVISSTAAPHPIITKDKLIPLMKARRLRPAVPHRHCRAPRH